MSSSLRPGPDWAKHVGVLVTVVALGAALVARFSALEEAKQIAIEKNTAQDRVLEKQEDRIRALETARALEQQMADMKADIAALKAQVNARDEQRIKRK